MSLFAPLGRLDGVVASWDDWENIRQEKQSGQPLDELPGHASPLGFLTWLTGGQCKYRPEAESTLADFAGSIDLSVAALFADKPCLRAPSRSSVILNRSEYGYHV